MGTTKIDVRTSSGRYTLPSESVSRYLREIRKFPLLSEDEEMELMVKYQDKGDGEALNQIICCNQRFVYAIAKRIAPQNAILDAINEGNLGLIAAAKKYDRTKGFRFISYAVWYVRLFINSFVLNNGVVRKPCNNRNSTKVNKIKNRFYLENGKMPTDEEIVEIFKKEFGIKILDHAYLQDIESVSLDSTIDNGKSTSSCFEDSPEFTSITCSKNNYEEDMESEYKKEIVKQSLSCLSEREREIIVFLFGIDNGEEKTMEEASEKFGLTKERIRQIKIHSLNKLKKIVKKINNTQAI